MNGFAQLIGMRAATIYEAAGKLGDMSPEIRSINPDLTLIGPAYTVKCWPGDGLAFLNAVCTAPPGSVLVIDGGDSPRNCCWGGSATIAAKGRGIAGVVTNGSVRDTHIIAETGFPVFAAGTSVRGGLRNHPGWAQIPISVGGVAVHPDDLIVADNDGVVVIEAARLSDLVPRAVERHAAEERIDADLRAGGDFAQLAGLAPLS